MSDIALVSAPAILGGHEPSLTGIHVQDSICVDNEFPHSQRLSSLLIRSCPHRSQKILMLKRLIVLKTFHDRIFRKLQSTQRTRKINIPTLFTRIFDPLGIRDDVEDGGQPWHVHKLD